MNISGIPLTDGATVRLQAMVGLSRALDLILTGRSLTAKEALDWGVVNRIVACGTGKIFFFLQNDKTIVTRN